MRASDADRDRTAELLREAYAEGRLSVDEHEERLDRAYQAKTVGELRELLVDLPVGRTESAPNAQVGTRSTTDLASTSPSIVAVLSESKRTGRWLVPEHLVTTAFLGSVDLDLTEAVLERNEVTIVANSVLGNVTLRVPDGVVVRDEGVAIMGAREIGNVDYEPGAPVITLKGICLMGSVEVKKPKRRDKRR
jgi:hypothetical protein